MAEGKDFYEDEKVEEEPEKVKIGEEEYTQDELNRLVGLGKIALEAEEKYKKPIDRYWPEYTKSRQRELELEKELEEARKAPQPSSPVPTGEVSEEEMKKQALEQADKLGILHQGNISNVVREIVEGQFLLQDIRAIVTEATEGGRPVPAEEELLRYMGGDNTTGTKYGSPWKAYEDMFESQLKAIEQKKLEELKPEGLPTQEPTSTGAKQPEPPPPLTKETLRGALDGFLKRASGSEKT